VASGGGIRHPKDLEGRRVGVDRGYTVTTGVWARAILRDEYGVDLDKVTWVLSGDEHVAEYVPPPNVVSLEPGRTFDEMLATGELAAVVGAKLSGPDVAPLLPDPVEAGFAALQHRGLYPINHLVVVRDELLEAAPGLAKDVFDAFALAKSLYVEQLRRGEILQPTATDRMYARVLETTGQDPLPYGIAPNRDMIDELIDHAVSQHILKNAPSLEALFAQATLDLTA
jgi:4,5-dihydroxyphthalate decarboxylase